MGMKNALVIFFLFVACDGNYQPKDVGSLSILEYPDNKDLNNWIQIDSQYSKVYQVQGDTLKISLKKIFLKKKKIK